MNSHVLHGSESLCKLLRYLAEHAIDIPAQRSRNIRLLPKSSDAPRIRPAVRFTIRVQAGRLRSKIAEYYNSEGAEDPIQLEMPKGTYVLSFHRREPSPAKLHGDPTYPHKKNRRRRGGR